MVWVEKVWSSNEWFSCEAGKLALKEIPKQFQKYCAEWQHQMYSHPGWLTRTEQQWHWWRRGWDWWIRGGWWACGSPRGSCGESHDMDTAPGRARADRPVPSAHWNHCAVTGQAEDSCLLCHRCPDPANQKQLTVSSSKIPGCTPWGATVLCGCTTDSVHWFFKCGDYCPSNGRETETEACERTFLKWHS